MKISRSIRLGIGAIAVALAATACGGDESRSVTSSAENGNLVVGIKFDQPGLGLRNPDGTFSGFDVEVAKYVAGQLGVSEENIEFKESPSAQRETLIQNGEVDYIVATYSITDAARRRSISRVRTSSRASRCWCAPTKPISPVRNRSTAANACAR